MSLSGDSVRTQHLTLQSFRFFANASSSQVAPEWLFTDNETNKSKLFGTAAEPGYFKDAFHQHVVEGQASVLNPESIGTKVGAHYHVEIPAGAEEVIELRLVVESECDPEFSAFGRDFADNFALRKQEADEYHAAVVPASLPREQQEIVRQSHAGLCGRSSSTTIRSRIG